MIKKIPLNGIPGGLVHTLLISGRLVLSRCRGGWGCNYVTVSSISDYLIHTVSILKKKIIHLKDNKTFTVASVFKMSFPKNVTTILAYFYLLIVTRCVKR